MPIEPSFNTSFIPKKSLQSQAGGGGQYVKRRGTYGPGFFVSSLIFAITLLVSAGLFFYSGTIERSIDGKIQQLEFAREALRPDLIAAFEYLDLRLANAKLIVSNHRGVSALLGHLEDVTLKDVRYIDFSYKVSSEAAGNQNTVSQGSTNKSPVNVTIRGYANTVESMALQVDQYRASEYISNVALQSLDRDIEESAETEFMVALTIDPRLVAFVETLEQINIPSVVSSPVVPTDELFTTQSTTTPEIDAGTSASPTEVITPSN